MALKVLLTKPKVKYPVKADGDLGVPLGALYLASYARQENPHIEISFRDYRLEAFKGIDRDLESDIADFDVIAVGGSTTEIPDTLKILETAKKLGKITVSGGIFPTSNPEYVLGSGVVDYIVKGEGEATFSEILNALDKNRFVSTHRSL